MAGYLLLDIFAITLAMMSSLSLVAVLLARRAAVTLFWLEFLGTWFDSHDLLFAFQVFNAVIVMYSSRVLTNTVTTLRAVKA